MDNSPAAECPTATELDPCPHHFRPFNGSNAATAGVLELPEEKSHLAVRRLLFQLPVFDDDEWTVAPLETFEEWIELLAS